MPSAVPTPSRPTGPHRALLVFIVLAGLIGVTEPARSQTSLDLEECIALAVRNGPAARAAALRFAAADWDYRGHRATRHPILTLQGSAPGVERSIGEVTRDDGSVAYVEQNRLSSNLDLSLDQVIPQTGGRISLGSGLARTDEFGEIDRTLWQSTPLTIRLEQPIFGFNAAGWEGKAARRQHDLARRTYLWDREGVAVEVADRFFRLHVAALELANAEANAAVNDSLYQLSRGRYEIGSIAENDLLQSELALIDSQTDLADLRIGYERALQNLKIELGLAYDTPLAIDPPEETVAVEIDPVRAVQTAREHRPDYAALALADLEAERSVARARATDRLSADLSASYGLNQTGDDVDEVYRDPLDRQRLDLGFRVPILGWGRNRAAVQSATAAANRVSLENDRRRLELDQETYFEARRFELLEQQLRTAAQADTVAARRFEVARNRYLIGKIGINDLYDAQQQKDSAKTRYYETLRAYWVAFHRLRQLTLYDFVLERPIEDTSTAR